MPFVIATIVAIVDRSTPKLLSISAVVVFAAGPGLLLLGLRGLDLYLNADCRDNGRVAVLIENSVGGRDSILLLPSSTISSSSARNAKWKPWSIPRLPPLRCSRLQMLYLLTISKANY